MESVVKLVTFVMFMTFEETVWIVFQTTFFPKEFACNHNPQARVQQDNTWVMTIFVMNSVIFVRFTKMESVDNAANVSMDIS